MGPILSLELTAIQSTVPIGVGHRIESWLLGFIPVVKLVIVSGADIPKDVRLGQLSVMEHGVGAGDLEPLKTWCCTCALSPLFSNCLSGWQGWDLFCSPLSPASAQSLVQRRETVNVCWMDYIIYRLPPNYLD